MTSSWLEMAVSSGLIWLIGAGLPLVIACALLARRWRPAAMFWAPWSALPMLMLAVLPMGPISVDVPWLLLGSRLGIDETARAFLFLTSLLWLTAGLSAGSYLAHDPRRHRFLFFYLLTMSGNLGLVVAGDMVSFYLFFALMSFASYGLVVYNRDEEAIRAGRVYMILVVVGEMALFATFVLAASTAGHTSFAGLPAAVAQSPVRDLIMALALVGLGIKAGLLPLHFWLPLAHPAAPAPASAVLSGAMIKAGLIGWIRLLPLGTPDMESWAHLCIAAGIAGAFYGVGVGLTQTNPKTVLAYSSISQMGWMITAIGLGLSDEMAAPVAVTVVSLFAMHHGLAKGALFLGVAVASAAGGAWMRRLTAAGLLFGSLSLAGAPLTSGAIAKGALKAAVAGAPGFWPDVLAPLLSLGTIATTLLMIRFLVLVWPRSQTHGDHEAIGLLVPWGALLAAVLLAVPLWPWGTTVSVADLVVSPAKLWSAAWPVSAGAAIAGLWLLASRTRSWRTVSVPAGDLVVLLESLAVALGAIWQTVRESPARLEALKKVVGEIRSRVSRMVRATAGMEVWLIRGTTFAAALLSIWLGLFVLLMFS